jgi:drug/metabolite transporter (DMT)-like permease
MNRRLLPALEATLAVLIWGATFIATKVALRDVSPVTIVWLRFGIGVLVLGGAVLLRRQFAWPNRRELAYFALLGFLGITFHQGLQSIGLQTSQASTTAWIVATTPIFMALLGWLVLRESIALRQALGIGLATGGVLLVVTGGDLSSLANGQFGAPGDILILVSSLNWAIFSALSRWGLKRHPATRMMFFVMTCGWLFVSLLFFWPSGSDAPQQMQFLQGGGLEQIAALTLPGWLAILFLGLFGSGLAYIFWYDALQSLPTSQVGAFLYIEPIVAVVVAAVILGEPIVLASLAGGALILFGVWLVQAVQSPAKQGH